jgi:restriction endonuclease
MKRIELVKFNAELFQKMKSTGVRLEDSDYIAIYDDYAAMSAESMKKTAIMAILAERYRLTSRHIHNILKRLNEEV